MTTAIPEADGSLRVFTASIFYNQLYSMKLRFLKPLLLTLALIATAVQAQQLPLDPVVRKGTLPNGLTYYVARNTQTPKVADFYIAQRVGSILEEPRQRGLAHFLEHMAFNGSKHFPGGNDSNQSIVKWCESVGIKFGANLNAYTSIEQTVYNISAAPVVREGVIDSCLLILNDWSHDLSLNDSEIDKERGVIREEWRSRRAGMAVQRLMEEALPVMFQGSKYADCMPIGNIDIINNFPYKDLRDYYHKWYRPDLQAIIVVGDIDPAKIEQKIKNLFGSIPAPVNPAKREYYPVPDNEKMIVFTATDKEQPTVNFSLYMKRDATPRDQRNTLANYADGYKAWLIRSMLNDRMQLLYKVANPPFMSGSVRDGSFFVASTKDAFNVSAMLKPDNVLPGISALMGEVERARQHGFTQTELDRAKAEQMRFARNGYEDRDKRRNGQIVSACVSNFTDGEPMLSPEEELNIVKQLDASVTLADVNAATRELITDRNQVVTIYGPTKNGFVMPSHKEIEKAILTAQAQQYPAYKEAALPTSLMPRKPKAGKITKEEQGPHGYTKLTLSNGMKVYVRPTDFEADDISMRLFSLGGRSLYPDADVPSLTYLASTIGASGVGQFDEITLDKMLAGKTVSVSPYIGEETEGVSASSGKADLPTMLELTHLYFTAPRRDEEAFNSLMNRQRSFLRNRDASPMVAYNDSIKAALYGHSERTAPVTVATIDKVSLDRIMQIYKERFADASDFTAVITGNVDMKTLRPLICTYLASLPATHHPEQPGPYQQEIRPVTETHYFEKEQATPATTTQIFLTAPLAYTADNDLKLDVLGQLMRMVYTQKVREEKGGTYGVSVSGDFQRYPQPEAIMKISFRTDPEKYAELIPIIYAELERMAQEGPAQADLDKVKEYELKTYGQVEVMNDYWHYIMYTQLLDGVDTDTDYKERVKALTVEGIRDLAKQILAAKRRIEVTMSAPAAK